MASDTGWGGLSKDQWGGIAAGGVGVLPLLFGGQEDKDVSAALGSLKQSTADVTAKAGSFGSQGSDLLSQALSYLKSVTGGDQQSALTATMPERRRIIDQYDTAKKSIAEFSPRGGGTAGALAGVNASEASDLAQTTAAARKDAMGQAASLGVQLQQLGLTADQLASGDIHAILNAAMNKDEAKAQKWSQVGSALGLIAGSFFGPAGAAAGSAAGKYIGGKAAG